MSSQEKTRKIEYGIMAQKKIYNTPQFAISTVDEEIPVGLYQPVRRHYSKDSPFAVFQKYIISQNQWYARLSF